jgi:hypothetical protein
MWLDADDVMPSESRTEIQNLKVSIFSDKEVDAASARITTIRIAPAAT